MKSSSRKFTLFLLVCLLFGQATVLVAKETADKRPNILFIYTDDHSHRTVSCYDEAFPWVKTPTIDRLAKEGVRFEYAYIGTWCMPSRATLLTGHHQFAVESMRMVGDYPGSDYDHEKCPFWPRVFRKNGYQTAQIGKWHTGVDTGYGRDWDYQIVWNRPKHTKNHQAYYYGQPVTFQGGETKTLKRYSTDQYTDWAIDYLEGEGRDENKPWYLWVCYGAVHSPFTPADRHMDNYPDISIPQPKDIFPPRPGKPEWMQSVKFWEKGKNNVGMWKGRTLTSWVRQYHQSVVAIDENINRLLKTLDKTGQRENTLIIFTSDQGHAWGQHGFRQKVAAYDATIRSPMIVSFPKGGVAQGKVCPHPVGGVDIVPTIFSFAGIERPWEMHGHDLTPLLKNPTAKWPHTMMLTATGRKYGSDTHKIPTGKDVFHGAVPWYVMIRKGRYKYVRPMIHDLEEVYDMKADPNELNNLAVKPDFQSTLKELRAEALKELRRTKAGFVGNLPKVREGA
ncbi:MAG: sulfatase [Planctomycetaceae bacterium]|nr:sulfatase [Planctomycetaceae bacterium]